MKSLREAARKAGVSGLISVRAVASKTGLNPPISVKTLIYRLEAPPTPTPTPTPTPIPNKPSISVSSNGDGSFIVTGTQFLLTATIHIRVVDDALTNVYLTASSTPKGTFSFPTGKLCQQAGNLHFSANDGRSDKNDVTGTLWSNTVTVSCPL